MKSDNRRWHARKGGAAAVSPDGSQRTQSAAGQALFAAPPHGCEAADACAVVTVSPITEDVLESF
jgi:hypothetical protein